jgi:hypothetical protein
MPGHPPHFLLHQLCNSETPLLTKYDFSNFSPSLLIVCMCEHMLTPSGCLGVPFERLFYMTFRSSLLEKQSGSNESSLFLRVDLIYYSLLSIFGISGSIFKGKLAVSTVCM